MSQILPLVRRIAQKAAYSGEFARAEKFFIFDIGRKAYAIPAVDVTEVAMPLAVIDIPQKSRFLTGVVNVRGTVVPVIDLRAKIGIAEPFIKKDCSRMLVFTLEANLYAAMFVDDIEYRLRDGIVEPLSKSISDEKVFRSVSIEMQEYPVLMVDDWVEKDELELLRSVVSSF